MRTKPLNLAAHAVVLGAFAVPLALAGNAAAAECSSLPKPVVVAGSSAVASFIQAVGKALAENKDVNGDPDPITVIYASKGSCVGVKYLTDESSEQLTGSALKPPYGTTDTCDNTAAIPVDIGLSDVFASSCQQTLPDGVKDFFGPVQTMTFAVSAQSSRQVISAEAAYLTFGFPNGDGQSPWNDPTAIWMRDETSGTQQMIAHAIGVPAELWQAASGHKTTGATIISSLQAAATAGQDAANAAIGILAMDAIRGNAAGDVVPLAYQHTGQTCGYLPSSGLASNDMQNTRDGHYMIQGPLHMITKVSGGKPVNANAETLINYMSGKVIPKDFDLIALEAAKSVVPDCAMRVTRDSEVGPFMSYMPDISCECKFLSEATASVPAECTTCDPENGNDDCTDSARPHCNYGFCEVQ